MQSATAPTRPSPAVALLDEALRLAEGGPALLRALLSLLGRRAEVCFHDLIPTAALVPVGDSFVVAIGTKAFGLGKLDARDLLYLIAHELVHLIRDDLVPAASPFEQELANIAADAVNDAWLTGPAFEGFFCPIASLPGRRPPTHPVNGLLIPLRAAHALLGEPDRPHPPASTSRRFFTEVLPPPPAPGPVPYDPTAWAAAHQALQRGGADGSLTGALALPLIRPLFDQLPPLTPDPMAPHPFLAGADGRRLTRQLREQAARLGIGSGPALRGLGRHHDRGHQAGPGGPTELSEIRAEPPERRLERFLRRIAAEAAVDLASPSPLGPRPCPTELGPRVGGRAAAEWVAGARATPFVEARPEGGDLPLGLAVYLDASGSMDKDLPRLVATLAARCVDLIAPPLSVFSIRVHHLSPAALRQRRLPTEGGTSFEALAQDLLDRRVSRAVVLTDGCAPSISPALIDALRRQRTRVALVFPGPVGTCPLDPLCPPGWRISLNPKGTTP